MLRPRLGVARGPGLDAREDLGQRVGNAGGVALFERHDFQGDLGVLSLLLNVSDQLEDRLNVGAVALDDDAAELGQSLGPHVAARVGDFAGAQRWGLWLVLGGLRSLLLLAAGED